MINWSKNQTMVLSCSQITLHVYCIENIKTKCICIVVWKPMNIAQINHMLSIW